MFNHGDCIHFHVLRQICVFYLTKDAFVECPVSFGLPGQLLITDRCAVEHNRDALLVV